MEVYLDNAATTKVDEKVLKTMNKFFTESYGNASSLHKKGIESKNAIEKARKIISKKIGAKTNEIYFTSGATESNNWALKGLFWENHLKKNHIITSKIEHDAILNTCKWLETQGAKVTYLDVDTKGFVDTKELENNITDKTFLVSIMHANNEIGTIQNIKEIGRICKEKNILFHTDATQSLGKVKINTKKMNIDLLSASSHKIHGPKGVGFLYIKQKTKITPLIHGGGHERKMRSGTENISGIIGMAKALEISKEKEIKKMKKLRDKLINGILNNIPKTKLNGPLGENRLANNVNISFTNVEGETIGGYLENQKIFASTGSACTSNTLSTSHVLKAIRLTELEQNSSVRFSLSKYTKESQINYILKKLPKIIKKLRRLSPLVN